MITDGYRITEAQAFCNQNPGWLMRTCDHVVRDYWFPDYQQSAKTLARSVLAECGTIDNEEWRKVADKRHRLAEIVEAQAKLLAQAEAALTNAAQRFFLSFQDWVEGTCKQAVGNSPNHDEDILDLQNETYVRCGRVSDESWAQKRNKKKYVGKIIRNAARDVRNKARKESATDEVTLLSLLDRGVSHDAMEQMIAAILLREIHDLSSPSQQQLLSYRAEGLTFSEIADRENVKPEALRQSFSRLKRKAAVRSQGKSRTTDAEDRKTGRNSG